MKNCQTKITHYINKNYINCKKQGTNSGTNRVLTQSFLNTSYMSSANKVKEKNDLKDLKISVLESENDFLSTVVDTLKKGLHNIKLEYDFLMTTIASFENQQELKHLHKSINVTQFGPLNFLSLPPTPEANPLLSLPKIPASPYPSPKITPLITPDNSPISPYAANYTEKTLHSPIVWGGEEDAEVDAIACSQTSSTISPPTELKIEDKEDLTLYVRYVNRQKPILDLFSVSLWPIIEIQDYSIHNVDWRHKILFKSKEERKNFYNQYKRCLNGDVTLYTFDFLSFKNSCQKKHILFLNNLKALSKDTFKTQMFLFSTLFTLCDLLTKFKVLHYDISFTNISIYSEKYAQDASPFNYIQLRHTKKYFSFEDALQVRAYFDGLNIFENFNNI